MGAAYFYHLTEASAENALAMLLPRAAQAGWRVEIRGRDAARMEALDRALWDGAPESFLAHGLAGGPHDAYQPVLLTVGQGAGEVACVMTLDGAEISSEEAGRLERSCILFDGHDPDAVERARGQWRALTKAGIVAQYWAQDGGTWQRKA